MNYFRFALCASALTPILHIVVLVTSGQDWIQTPISQLSRHEGGDLHSITLVLFGAAHFALALGLRRIDHGRLWPWGRIMLVLAGLSVWYIAWYFVTADAAALVGPNANDPLWVAASLTGTAMGLLQPGLSRRSQSVGMFSAICLGIWLLLIPLILLVTESWLGAYERLVGIVYVIWLVGVSQGLVRERITPLPKPDAA